MIHNDLKYSNNRFIFKGNCLTLVIDGFDNVHSFAYGVHRSNTQRDEYGMNGRQRQPPQLWFQYANLTVLKDRGLLRKIK